MDKGIWSNRCTGHLCSSIALWRGGTHTGQTNITDAGVTSLALSLCGEEVHTHWTNKFGVTNARVTSLALLLCGKEVHTLDKQMIPCPHQTNYNIKSGSPLKGWVILQF